MNTRRIRTKAIAGPGGIKCPCCRYTRTIKASRIMHNRGVRRIFTRLIQVELIDYKINA